MSPHDRAGCGSGIIELSRPRRRAGSRIGVDRDDRGSGGRLTARAPTWWVFAGCWWPSALLPPGAPAWPSALVWLTCAVQVAYDVDAHAGRARRGLRRVRHRSLGQPAGDRPQRALDAGRGGHRHGLLLSTTGSSRWSTWSAMSRHPGSSDYSMAVLAVLMGMAVLGVPWLAGLTLRFSDRARQSQVSQVVAEQEAARAVHEAEQAREIARLREDQARLARDVHDVVGHSLAVILAQAESAQYLRDADTQKLKQTMENIATSARTSLQDVRQVLTRAAPSRSGPAASTPSSTAYGERARGGVQRGRPPPAAAARARGRRLPRAPGDADQRHQARPARRGGRSSSGTGRASCGSRCAT